MINKIEHVLEQFVRPKLALHYGDVKVINFEDGVLSVKMQGQCSNCPSAKFTIDEIIEKEIKEHVPEVIRVELMEGVSDELLDLAKKILNKEL